MNKILVTGGSGFIGSHTCEALIEKGYDVYTISRNLKPINLQMLSDHPRFHLIYGDILNNFDFNKMLKGIDCVIHLFWSNLPRNNPKFLTQDIHNSICNGIGLLDACIKNRVFKFIFASSGGTIYGEPQYVPIDEMHPTNPISSYGLTKLTFEKYLNYYHHEYGLDDTILRFSNVYGPRQNLKVRQGVISHWLNDINLNGKIELSGNGDNVRDYIYIADVVDAILLNLEKRTNKERLFNISSKIGVSLYDLIEIFRSEFSMQFSIDKKDVFSGDVRKNILDNARAEEMLHWSPKVSLKEGINKTIEYLKIKINH